MSIEKIRIGIVGVGGMGSGHVKNILDGKVPSAKLTAICDINPDRLVWAQETYPDAFAKFNTAEEILTEQFPEMKGKVQWPKTVIHTSVFIKLKRAVKMSDK